VRQMTQKPAKRSVCITGPAASWPRDRRRGTTSPVANALHEHRLARQIERVAKKSPLRPSRRLT
jgi:hypothetical protein